MAEKRSVIAQLQSVSEEALAKLASSDFASNAIQSAQGVKDRVERLVKTVAELDDRLAALEKRVSALEPKKATPATKTTSAAAAKKPPGSPRSTSGESKAS
jgi:phage shock protein A